MWRCWLATTAWAQNGLERFEKELKPQFEFKTFTYANAAPLGSGGFVLNDVVAVIPANAATGDKESTVKIQKVTVDALDFDRLKKDAKDSDAPRFAKLKLEGMTGDDEMFTALQPYGVPNVPLDIALDYTIDPATKVLDLKTLEIAMRGQAKFVLSLAVDGVSDRSAPAPRTTPACAPPRSPSTTPACSPSSCRHGLRRKACSPRSWCRPR